MKSSWEKINSWYEFIVKRQFPLGKAKEVIRDYRRSQRGTCTEPEITGADLKQIRSIKHGGYNFNKFEFGKERKREAECLSR